MTAVCIDLEPHLSLVRSTAWRLIRHYLLPVSIVDDLVGEGMLGLVEAREKYVLERGATFKTYSRYLVEGRMMDMVRRECRHIFSGPDPEHHHSMNPVEDAASAREELAMLEEVVQDLPYRRKKVMQSLINLQPIRKAAADMVVPLRKAQRWRRQVLAEVAEMAA